MIDQTVALSGGYVRGRFDMVASKSISKAPVDMPHLLLRTARPFQWLGLTVVCAILLSGRVFADISAPSVVPFSNQYHTAWSARDGMPPQVFDIAQTTDGFLWLASKSGLYHFDGIKFEPYTPPPGSSLLHDAAISLVATHDGGLWVGYQFGGASFIRQGTVTNYSPADTFNHNLQGLVEDLDGTIWGATHFGLQRFDGVRWTRIGDEWNFPLKALEEMHLDAQGTLWAGTHNSYYALRRGEKRFYDSGLSSGPANMTSENAGWVAESNSLVRLSRTGQAAWAREVTDIGSETEALATTRDGYLWIGTHDGIMRTNAKPSSGRVLERFRQQDGLSGSGAVRVFEDREANVWSLSIRGLDQFRTVPFNSVLLPPGMGNLRMLSLGESVLVASGARGKSTLLKVTKDDVVPVSSGLTHVYAVTADRRGGAWLAADGRFWHYTGNTVEPIVSPPLGGDGMNDNVSSMTVDEAGALWISLTGDRTRRVYKFSDGTWSVVEEMATSTAANATVMMTDHSGNVWMGLRNTHIVEFGKGHATLYTEADGLKVGIILALSEHGDHLWIGGAEGVAYFRNGRFRQLTNTEANLMGTCGIVELENGDLWLTSGEGVVKIEGREVAAALSDSSYRAKTRLFTHLDGATDFSGAVYGTSAIQSTNDGRLYVNSYEGIQWIDPQHILNNSIPPTARIASVIVDYHVLRMPASGILNKGAQNVEIDYTASSLAVPERVQFRYKLDGFDLEWQQAGNRRQAFYTKLPPGQYSFRVAASNNDGVWSTADATWDFELPPTFFQSVWFKLFCAAACTLVLVSLYFYRIRQITAEVKKNLLVRLAERERIARDLHDTFFQGVQGLLLRFNTGTSNLRPDDPIRALFIETLKQSDQVMAEGRDMVLDLRADEDVISALPDVLARAGEQLKDHNSANYKVVVIGQPRELQGLCAVELSRIGKEAIHNAFSHSQARSIECEIAYTDDTLTLMIRDNGIGIDANIVRDGRRAGHLGLPGMKERAVRIGAKLRIWSQKNGGSEVEVVVPGAVAYVTSKSAATGNRLWKLIRRPG
jgi:signal transduction histidine kinase/ligand-binding sensor domain-containing protein